MTVIERLFNAGLLDRFDAAARARDRASMVSILAEVRVGSQTADAILTDPGRYGF